MTRRHTVPGIPASPCWQRPMQTKPWSRRLWDTPVPWRSLNVSTPTWILKHWWRQSTRSKRKKEKPCSTKKQEIRSLRNDLLLHKAFVFACDSCSLCAPCLLLTKQNGTLLRNSHNSKSIQFSAKQRPKTHWEAVEIISWRTAERDERLWGRTARVFELFFLDIPGFSGFLLLGYPVCEPQKLSRFFMNSQALLLSAFRIFPQFTFYLINRRQRTFKILRYQFWQFICWHTQRLTACFQCVLCFYIILGFTH